MHRHKIDEFIVELDSPSALDHQITGTKAASVANLITQGINVPTGFVIPASVFANFIGPVTNEISRIFSNIDDTEIASIYEAEASIRDMLKIRELPQGLIETIRHRLKDISTGFAIRSSATNEDLATASFAGMYDTFLDGIDTESVLRRIRDVWISYYSGRAISYRLRHNMPQDSGSMAVLIMNVIKADSGGVVFTRDPRDGTDQILINVSLGLGEGVVSGRIRSDSFTMNSNSLKILTRNIIDKDYKLVHGTKGTIDLIPVPAEIRGKASLNDSQLTQIGALAKTIKIAANSDRDIEFAVSDNHIYIMQSRPVTTGSALPTVFPVKWDSPEQASLHWKAASKFPMKPLSIDYTLMAGKAQKRSVDITGQYMGRSDLKKMVNGYMFSAESPRDPETLKKLLANHHIKGRQYLEKRSTYYDEEVKPLLLQNLKLLDNARPLCDAPIPEHVANLRLTMQITADHMNDLHWRCWSGFPRDSSYRDEFAKLTGMDALAISVFTIGIDHMTARLTKRLIGMADIVKSDPWLSNIFESRDYEILFRYGNGIRPAVKKFRSRFRSMMKIWGFRNGLGYGTAWKDTDPSWNMKPVIPLDMIGSYLQQNLKKSERSHSKLSKKRVKAIRSMRQKLNKNLNLRDRFEFLLYAETSNVRMMENHNYLIEQKTNGEYRESIYRAGKALVREGWIDQADDIFFLRLDELEAAVSSGSYNKLRWIIDSAKTKLDKDTKLECPDFIGSPKQDEEHQTINRGINEDETIIYGEASSSGSFTGVARVILSRTATPPSLRQGEILVVENTGPDWVPVFPLLGGLILDGGDNFQHASLIAREYRIPCVIQTKDSTSKIYDGQLVTVNGTEGTVTLNPQI